MRFPVLSSPVVMTTLLLAGVTAAQAAGISRGAMLSNSCAACHGTDGHSPGAIPSIQGKSADFISNALKEFRAGTRPSTVMGRHATGYTDEEIELISKHFAGQQ
jgi:sulfide dehydrogenase cytochrome subunit